MFWCNIKSLTLWKKIYFRVSVAVFILLLLFCALRFATDRGQQLRLSGGQSFMEGTAGESTLYEGISLGPGVYEVVQTYRTDRDYSGICSVRDETVHPRALCTNGEHLYQGLRQTGYTLWLYQSTGHLQVTVSYSGEGMLETGELLIVNTGKLWSMLFVILFCMGLAAFFLLVFLHYDRQYGVSGSRKRIFLFLMLITFLASLPQLHTYLLGGADLTYHLQRIEGVKDGLLAGQFPVRLEPEWLYGHGYANGVFYCNALLYLPAFLRLAGFDVTISYQLFCIGLNFATAVIAWYCFGKIFRDDRIGLMCSALYTLSIIRIYKLFMVGAVGEGSALTFLPLVFYGMYRIFTENPEEEFYRTVWLPAAFGYAGLMQTHVLTCEMTAFVTILACAACVRRIFRPRVFVALVKGALGAAGLSLWYLVPFLDYFLTQDMHIRHVSGRTIQERGLYFGQLFVNSWSESAREALAEKGLADVDPVSPGWLCLLALAVFFLLWLCGRLRGAHLQDRLRKCRLPGDICGTAKFSALAAVLLLFMTLRAFPWNRLQELGGVMASLVSSLQFPNRFMGWAMVFMITVLGFLLSLHRDQKAVLLTGVLLVAASVLTSSVYMMSHADREEEHYHLYNEEGMGCGYISGAEYLVEGTDDLLLTFTGPTAGEKVRIADYEKRYLHVKLSCVNESGGESYVELPILLYKGYQARAASGERLAVVHGENHKLRVILPSGFDDTLDVRFVSPFYWRISELVTVLTVGGIIFAGRRYRYGKRYCRK